MRSESISVTTSRVLTWPQRIARVCFRTRYGSIAVVVTFVLLLGQQHGRGEPGDALLYSAGYMVTGNYVVGGVNLTEQDNPIDGQGFSKGTINISGIPPEADIVAAYLYWETITYTANPEQAAGVTFRDEPINLDDPVMVKRASQPLTGSTASCWSSGTPLSMHFFRADVLRFLPIRYAPNIATPDDNPTIKRLVNDTDLQAHNLPLHDVKLPARQGNQIPESAGGTLVVVYNNPSEPLRKIVFYDGIHIQADLNATMTQTLQGFYRSATTPSAKLTHIIGSGQPNGNERIQFRDANVNSPNSPNAWADGVRPGSRRWRLRLAARLVQPYLYQQRQPADESRREFFFRFRRDGNHTREPYARRLL